MRLVTDAERRTRIGLRHALAPRARASDPEAATRAMTVLHSTEPATVYLSLRARVPGLSLADVDRALYVDRSLVKQLAMRRTLFVFPRDLLPAAWGSASARVAVSEGKRIAGDVVRAGLAADGQAWLERVRSVVLDHLRRTPGGCQAAEVRELLPELASPIAVSAGSVWNHSRVLTHLGATADIVRGVNTSHWRVSRPRWVACADWLGEVPAAASTAEGWAELVRRWLRSFGPGTTDDLVWWLGATKGIVSGALADIGAVGVELEDGSPAHLLAEDLDPVAPAEPWAALLPVLDPTVMGWKGREFFLGPHGPALFDRNGNAGTTAWWGGRVVGCWVQDGDGVVRLELLEEVPAAGRAALADEAAQLTGWLSGERVGTVYPSPAMKIARDRLEADR